MLLSLLTPFGRRVAQSAISDFLEHTRTTQVVDLGYMCVYTPRRVHPTWGNMTTPLVDGVKQH